MIVMCHKPTQKNNTCRPSTDTINITRYNNTANLSIAAEKTHRPIIKR